MKVSPTTSAQRVRAYRAKQSLHKRAQINTSQRLYKSSKRKDESPEERAIRLAKDRERKRKQRDSQTTQDIERLNSQRRHQRRQLQSESSTSKTSQSEKDTNNELLSDDAINKANEALKECMEWKND